MSVLGSLVLTALVGAGPWALMTQHVMQRCGVRGCRVVQQVPLRHLVQRFATETACLQALEPMHQQMRETQGRINQMMQDQHPRHYIRATTTFMCELGDVP
jgi:hypothetical protein